MATNTGTLMPACERVRTLAKLYPQVQPIQHNMVLKTTNLCHSFEICPSMISYLAFDGRDSDHQLGGVQVFSINSHAVNVQRSTISRSASPLIPFIVPAFSPTANDSRIAHRRPMPLACATSSCQLNVMHDVQGTPPVALFGTPRFTGLVLYCL